MTEAEAEMVLLALGPQLTWHNWNIVSGDEGECFSQLGATIYTCTRTFKSKPDWQASVRLPQRRDISVYYGFKTLAAAKAACGCHHATGEWE